MNNNEELKVSDWSQKWKLLVYAVAILGATSWIYFYVMPWMEDVKLSLQQSIPKNESIIKSL